MFTWRGDYRHVTGFDNAVILQGDLEEFFCSGDLAPQQWVGNPVEFEMALMQVPLCLNDRIHQSDALALEMGVGGAWVFSRIRRRRQGGCRVCMEDDQPDHHAMSEFLHGEEP